MFKLGLTHAAGELCKLSHQSPEPHCLSSITICRYDCSSADLNPIGAISKNDLRRFLVWAAEHLGYSELTRVVAAPPTAELEPVRQGVAAQVGLWPY